MGGRRKRLKARSESGVAFVEFALILPVFLLLVVGIIEFGLALNYWLDMTHTANQGARYAVVNLNPVCTGTAPTPCTLAGNPATFNDWLKNELTGNEIKNQATDDSAEATVTVCYNDDDGISGPTVGDPITVKVISDYNWMPFFGGNGRFGIGLTTVTLVGKATMRLERVPDKLDPPLGVCPP